ncbi:MAG: hypothetical protein QOK29_3957 [Rhodospirillaceae bacterium]|nr:hypothetical protein [Rhodospirillaceae bacterium]
MMRSKRLPGTAVLVIGLGFGLSACAGGDRDLAYAPYPYEDGYYNNDFLFFGGDFHDRDHFRFHDHDRFDHDRFDHDRFDHGRFDHGRFDHGPGGMHRMFRAGGLGHGGFGRGMGGHGGGGHR